MSKADTLAKLVSTGGPLVDGAVAVSDISGLQTTLDGKLALSGGTLTGNLTFNGTQTWPTFNQNTTGSAATATTSTNVSGGTANVTTLITSSTVTLNGGTANGVTYLNGSKVLTSGSALTFDTNLFTAKGSNGGYSLAFDSTTTPLILKTNDITGASYAPLAFSLGNGTGSYIEQMRLTSTGLGIGTSSPVYKLVVSNAGANGFEFDPVNSILQTYNRSGAAYTAMNLLGLSLLFKTGASPVTTMTLNSSGNLGVGIAAPAAAIDAYREARVSYASGNQYRMRFTNSDGNGRILVDGDTSALIFGTSSSGSGATATERMLIDSSGNVGIGTTSPAVKLELSKLYVGAGPTWAGGDDMLKLTAASGSAWGEPAIAFHEIGSNIGAKIGVKNSGNGAMNIIFANRDGSSLTSTMTERMRIATSGVVSIGSINANQIHTDIMAMWRTADIQGYKTDYGDGGGISYTWDNGTVRIDSSVGSHGWDIGKIYLAAGTYQLVFQYRPSPTQHGWNVYGSNSNGHSVRLISDAGYGSFTTYATATAPSINKDLGYSITYTSEIYTVATGGTFRISMVTDPYSGGGYKYFAEAAYVIRLR